MKRLGQGKSVVMGVLTIMLIIGFCFSAAAAAPKGKTEKAVKAAVGISLEQFPDMSDFDPSHPVVPAGDTIKIAVAGSFSEPVAINGQLFS